MTTNNIAVKNNEAELRYEADVDGSIALIQYEMRGDRIVFLHTEVPDALEGRGIGSTLVKAALEDVRARNLLVIPLCPFVSAYIKRHPEYLPLVEQRYRARLT